jgi:amino acid adenylation domain-containing protein
VSSGATDNLVGDSATGGPHTIAAALDCQVAKTPESIALVFGDQALTYRQLDSRANQLARHLQTLGAGPGSLVGVFLERSVELIVALLGTLKAGAAHVPLDSTYPRERTALVLDDCRAALVVSQGHLRSRLPATQQVVLLDRDAAVIAEYSSEAVGSETSSTDLAYVIYTSGSTGKPKGVMVEHRNVLSFFDAMDRLLGSAPGTWLAVTSTSFDISVLELLWTLARGFKVVLHGDEGTHTLAGEIERHAVTHFQSTPSLVRMLAADPKSLSALGSVKTLLVGGEAFPAALLATLRRVALGDIFNMYGPTETTVWSTAYQIPRFATFTGTVPIGLPFANTRGYLLDPNLNPVPPGEAGELFLAGDGVARGYWERLELTAERFLADPSTGGRMYRTGDLARQLPDGNLEFLGRTDFQVKLRGHRIELGEIETVLESLPGVRQAVVDAREDRPGDKRLVAYLVANNGQAPSAASVRAALGSKLPEYMVPAHVVFLDRLPLTANGKIDRKALPSVSSRDSALHDAPAELGSGVGHNEPRQAVERTIVEVWAAALGVGRVDTQENLFDLGATSLMMAEVHADLQRKLAREIPLVELFEFHTVSALAAHLVGESAPVRVSNRGERRRAARVREGPQ